MPRVAFLFCGLAGLLLAQAPPAADDSRDQAAPPKEAPAPGLEARIRAFLPTPPPVCAIPLLNVLRSKAEPMPVVRPPAGTEFVIRQVRPPAPACGAPLNARR